MEIISGVERRRRWRVEEKLRIVAEVEQPGASFADVARQHEVSRGLLWNWRQQVRRGLLVQEPMPTFLPVQVAADGPSADHRLMTAPVPKPVPGPAAAALIEITLPDGTSIRVGTGVDLAALRRVMAAVRR